MGSSLVFMKPLIDDMVQDDPSKRPSMEEAKVRFERIRDSLSWWTLRSQVVYRSDWSNAGLSRCADIEYLWRNGW